MLDYRKFDEAAAPPAPAPPAPAPPAPARPAAQQVVRQRSGRRGRKVAGFLSLLALAAAFSSYEIQQHQRPVQVAVPITVPDAPARIKPEAQIKPEATIENLPTEYNVMHAGAKGMMVHFKVTTKNLQGDTCQAVAFVYYNDTNSTPVPGATPALQSKDGHLAVWDSFTPYTDDATLNDLTLFIPYSAFNVARTATLQLKYHIAIRRLESSTDLTISPWQYFHVNG